MAPVAFAARPPLSLIGCAPPLLVPTMPSAAPDLRSSQVATHSDPSSEDADDIFRKLLAMRISNHMDRVSPSNGLVSAIDRTSSSSPSAVAVSSSSTALRDDNGTVSPPGVDDMASSRAANVSSPSTSHIDGRASPVSSPLPSTTSPPLSAAHHVHQPNLIPHHHHSPPFSQTAAHMPGLLPLVYGHPQPMAQALQMYPMSDSLHAASSPREVVGLHSRASPVVGPRPAAHSHTMQHIHGPAHTYTQAATAGGAPRIKNDLYKTEICRSFSENNGFCKYGTKCQFAHGEAELRPVRRHPRYKTKLCRNFSASGSCPYDARCRFIHAPADFAFGAPTAASSADAQPAMGYCQPQPATMASTSAAFGGHMAEVGGQRYSSELVSISSLLQPGSISTSMTMHGGGNAGSSVGPARSPSPQLMFGNGFGGPYDMPSSPEFGNAVTSSGISPPASTMDGAVHSRGMERLDGLGNGDFTQSLMMGAASRGGLTATSGSDSMSPPAHALATAVDELTDDDNRAIVNGSDLFDQLSLNLRVHAGTEANGSRGGSQVPRGVSSHGVLIGGTRSRLPVFQNMGSGQE